MTNLIAKRRGWILVVIISALAVFSAYGCGGSSDESHDLVFKGRVSHLQGARSDNSQDAAAGVQVCALGQCRTTDGEGRFSFPVDSQWVVEGRVLFSFHDGRLYRELMVENIPAGQGWVEFFFRLKDNAVFGGVADGDVDCLPESECGVRGCSVCSYTLMIDFVVEDYWETGHPSCGNCGSYIRSKTWQDSNGVWHDQVEEWEYVYRTAVGAEPNPDNIDLKAAPADSRTVTYLIARRSGGRLANYVHIDPGSGGGTTGYALQLSVNGQLVFAKFLPFEQAIRAGNDFVGSGRLPSAEVPSDPSDAEINRGIANDREGIVWYEKGNARAAVTAGSNANIFNVVVNVDGKFVVRVQKDCHQCIWFDFVTADARARSYVELLQGWIHN